MTALPWFLLAFGVVVLIVGYFLAYLGNSGSTYINPRMSDDEIAEQLDRGPGLLPMLVMLAGVLCIGVSIVWRIVLWVITISARA